jgi:hypothetical protein
MGHAAETEAHINETVRLSPRDMFAHRWLMMVGFAKLQTNADAEALCWSRRSIEANRNYPPPHIGLAVTLALRGPLDEARTAAKGRACDRSELYHPPLPRGCTKRQSNLPRQARARLSRHANGWEA